MRVFHHSIRLRINLVFLLTVLLGPVSLGFAFYQEPTLPVPPRFPSSGESDPWVKIQLESDYSTFLPLTFAYSNDPYVNLQSRDASLNFFLTQYQMAADVPIDWTGSHDACDPGATSPEFQEAVLRRINYFRGMAGVPTTVTFNEQANRLAQAAALLMSVNGQLDHFPPNTWQCYSQDGYDGAGHSNLALAFYGWNAIDRYMLDPGESNYFLGHRRWILYPQTREMGTGDVPELSGLWGSNALYVIDTHFSDPRPAVRDEFVAWPPPGYVPYPVVYPRWSFSYPEADFSGAAVTMTEDGSSITVAQAELVPGFGENTLVWIPNGLDNSAAWPQPAADTVYQVTISNVVIEGEAREFVYDVTVFDHNP